MRKEKKKIMIGEEFVENKKCNKTTGLNLDR